MTKNQTHLKLSEQSQIPHHRFGFGTRHSYFLEKLERLVHITANMSSRDTERELASLTYIPTLVP